MKTFLKKSISLALTLLMLITLIPVMNLSDVDLGFIAKAATYQVGDLVSFGSYPQSKVTDNATITALNNKAPAWDNWTSYEYYAGDYSDGSMAQGDWMRYVDITLNGEMYRGVKFTQYRPWNTTYQPDPLYGDYNYIIYGDDNCTRQDNNGYISNETYWFKFEPIVWRVLDLNTGLVMCETIIDAQAYSNTYYYDSEKNYNPKAYFNDPAFTNFASDYATSSIRTWLNDDFYNTAFTDAEKYKINITTLDNGCYETLVGIKGYEEYDSKETNDKIFLLSYNDVINSDFGFSPDESDHDLERMAQGSAYAQCQGLEVCRDSECDGEGFSNWILRSPSSYSYSCCCVYDNGYTITYNHIVYSTDNGIRPALCLEDISKIPPHKHSYKDSVVEATCTNQGYTTYICSCGDSYIEEFPKDVNNHVGETEIRGYVAPSCTEDGYSGDSYCLDCGEFIEKGEVLPIIDHKDDDSNNICDNCGVDIGGEVECDHSVASVTLMNATCTQGGVFYDICSKCGEALSEIYTTDKLGHDMSVFSQTKAPMCIEKGEERSDCSRCDYYETREIKEKGHSFGEWVTVKEPTATETGLKQRICSICKTTEEEDIDKLPVLIDEETGIMIEYPAENYEGKMGMIIKESLDTTIINIVNAVGGKNKVFDIKLTLDGEEIQPVGKVTIKMPLPDGYSPEYTFVYYINTATGLPEKIDSRYENGYMVFETDHFSYYALAETHSHSYDNIVRKEATCTNNGLITYTCLCSDYYTEMIYSTGHTFDGSVCTVCGYDRAGECSCNCHKGGIAGFFFKIINFFQKLFGQNKVCACGVKH